jgi:hypothetical protein
LDAQVRKDSFLHNQQQKASEVDGFNEQAWITGPTLPLISSCLTITETDNINKENV